MRSAPEIRLGVRGVPEPGCGPERNPPDVNYFRQVLLYFHQLTTVPDRRDAR